MKKYRYNKRKQGTSNASKQQGNKGRRSNKASKPAPSLDPRLLINKASAEEQTEEFIPKCSIEGLPLSPQLKSRLAKKGFQHLTQIQQETLTPLVSGKDLLGIANTGTGKTIAFLVPIIEQFLKSKVSLEKPALVLVPTRELALQVEKEFKSISSNLGLHCISLIGGTSVNRDRARLRRPHHLTIATPGRLLDLARSGDIRLSEMSTLVLDEFDRMLDMGFVKDIMKIVRQMRNRQQTMLFSATLDQTQRGLIDELLHQPTEVKVAPGNTTSSSVEQDVIYVGSTEQKFDTLLSLLSEEDFDRVLIFAETKRLVDRVSKRLRASGVTVDLIHGNKTQNYRVKALDKFKSGKVQVLVATDVAARGIDVQDVSHVINYQVPRNYDSYIHRIGRSGRAGKKGKAFTFVDQKN